MPVIAVTIVDQTVGVTQIGEIGPTGATGTVSAAGDGSAGAPGIAFASDTDTGFWRPGTNLLAVSTAGSERMRINASGNVGIGTNDPSSGKLNVVGDQIIVSGGSGVGGLGLQIKGTAVGAIPAAQVQGYIATGDSAIGVAGDLLIAPRTSVLASVRFITGTTPAERMRIDPTGNVGIGTTNPANFMLQVAGHIGPNATGASNLGSVANRFGTLYVNSILGNGATASDSVYELAAGSLLLDNNRALRFKDNAGNGFSAIAVSTANNVSLNTSSIGGGIQLSANHASGVVQFFTNSVERMRVAADGSVGIGKTNPSVHLDVEAATSGTFRLQATNGNAVIWANVVTGGTAILDLQTAAGLNRICGGLGGTSNLGFYTGSTERMRIDASGNVGIGTTSPAVYTGYTTLAINHGTTGGVLDFLTAGTRHLTMFSGASTSSFGTVSASNLAFITTNLERMRLDASGNLGIGTNVPASKLDISGGQIRITASGTYSAAAINAGVLNYDSVSGDLVLAARSSGGSASFSIRTSNAGTDSEKFRILASGNVGIGTTGPGAKLHVSAGNLRLTATSDGSNGILQIQDTAASTLLQLYVDSTKGNIAVVEAKPMLFYTTNLERMRIDAAGNVGIGTTNPTSPLEIGAGFIEVANDGGLRSNISSTQRSLIQRTNTSELRLGENGGWTLMSFWPGSASSLLNLVAAGNIGIRTTDQFGSGVGVIGLANAATVPTTNPTAAGVLYAEAGALKWRGSSGTITTIANA